LPRGNDVDRAPAAAFSDDGVDLTLIRWMLSLTPLERLQVLQSSVTSIVTLRIARVGGRGSFATVERPAARGYDARPSRPG
jgi:hypothetical protein